MDQKCIGDLWIGGVEVICGQGVQRLAVDEGYRGG